MPAQATVYEDYCDINEASQRQKRVTTTLEFFDKTLITEIEQIWKEPKGNIQYIFDDPDIITGFAAGIKEYAFGTALSECGVTYTLGSAIPLAWDLEQEIEIIVKMSPKAVRRTIVRVTARNKGTPNPIL